jgi:hypothetical protein
MQISRELKNWLHTEEYMLKLSVAVFAIHHKSADNVSSELVFQPEDQELGIKG